MNASLLTFYTVLNTYLSHWGVSFSKEGTIAFTLFYCLHLIQSWTYSVIVQGEETEVRAKIIKEVK